MIKIFRIVITLYQLQVVHEYVVTLHVIGHELAISMMMSYRFLSELFLTFMKSYGVVFN